MGRDFVINGPCLVSVKGSSSSAISSLTQFGLSDEQIRVTLNSSFLPIKVNAWGNVAPEVEFMNASALIRFTVVHFDRNVLNTLLTESMGGAAAGATAAGTLGVAGGRLGNNAVQFAATNHYFQMCFLSPVANIPWRFQYCYLAEQPFEFPLGAERSVVGLSVQCIPYTIDPWNNGAGSAGSLLYDNLPPS